MTRTTGLSTLSCAALLVALGAYGCGSSSTINTGTGGNGGTTGGGQGGRTTPGNLGGNTGGGQGGAGGAVACMANQMCAAGFTCDQACMVGNAAGLRTCSCGGNGRLACPAGNANCVTGVVVDAGPPPPMMDAGFNMCMNNSPCTAGFNCSMNCNVNGNPGMRACTCANNGRLNCPGGNGGCMVTDAGPPPPMMDAGFNMCMNNSPCTTGFTCNAMCNVMGNPGTRPCTCSAQGRVNCPGGNGTCMVIDAGAPVDAARPDVAIDLPPG